MPKEGWLGDFKSADHKVMLLKRFHLTVMAVNVVAVGIDLSAGRYVNAGIEGATLLLLLLNLWLFRKRGGLKRAAYGFLAVISLALLGLVYVNHFATMSVVFVLLLPLTTLLFIRLRDSLAIMVIVCLAIGGLLYAEYLGHPDNPLVGNARALFNLAYTAVIIYIFGFLYHFAILKTFDELDASNRQKAMLLSEVHHRVKNNLNVIASIVGLQANRQKEGVREELLKSKARIESIAMVHEMLYRCDDFEQIDFESYMQRLSALLLGMYGMSREIAVNVESGGRTLPLEVMVQLGIMVNEMVTNSIKYAFEEKGAITMKLERDGDFFRFVYEDDGRGAADTEALFKSRSLGVKLIHLAAKQLGGSVSVKNDGGLVYTVEFRHA